MVRLVYDDVLCIMYIILCSIDKTKEYNLFKIIRFYFVKKTIPVRY